MKTNFFDSLKSKPSLAFLLILMSALGVIPLDVILPSISSISDEFRITTSEASAGIALFTVGVAIAQSIIGPISDQIGRKRTFLFCLTMAICGSWGCALADSTEKFYAFRAMQAIGCGGFVLSQAFIQDIFSPYERMRQRILLTSASGVFISISPAFGVLLQNYYGWKGSFYAFAALGLVVAMIAAMALPGKTTKPPILAGSAALFTVDTIRFIHGGLIATITFASHFSFIILSPVIFIEMLQLSLEQYGAIMLLYGTSYVAGGFAANFLSRRISNRTQIFIGLWLIVAGSLSMAILHTLLGMTSLTVISSIIISSCGVTLARPAATTIAMEAMPQRAGTAASGLNTLMFVGGGAISFGLGLFAPFAQWLLPTALFLMAVTGLLLCTFRPLCVHLSPH
ncbi:MFS transporter [Pseudomonas sp. RIT-PI-S]|uniref:MFS transporter n=1 Tax=Pseudomonas sp. RIT-PI-S TaxID=3035295 RepID=UPI0021D80C7A|nr:MFS transporter [Pseudomonas sp. RIT-PI-S]